MPLLLYRRALYAIFKEMHKNTSLKGDNLIHWIIPTGFVDLSDPFWGISKYPDAIKAILIKTTTALSSRENPITVECESHCRYFSERYTSLNC